MNREQRDRGCLAILGLGLGFLSSAIWLMAGPTQASAQIPCAPEDVATYLETIRNETETFRLQVAIQCAAKLAPTKETAQVLTSRLDRTLEETRRLGPGDRTDDRASIAAALAETLYQLTIIEGYEKIARYFASPDWSTRRDRGFFERIAAHASYRSELTEIFYGALSQLPASDALGRACSAFNRIGDVSVVRDDPRFIYGVLSALARLELGTSTGRLAGTPFAEKPQPGAAAGVLILQRGQPSTNYARESCEKALLSQLLDEKMRQAFLASFLDQLSVDERRVLDRFLAKIASPPDAEVAEQLITAFFAVPWKAEVSVWQQSNPRNTCKVFRGDGSYIRADDLWCVACSFQTGELRGEFYFYLDSQGKACTLQSVRFSYPSASPGVLTALTERLAQRMGPGTLRSGLRDARSVAMEEVFWNWQGREVYVFRNTSQARAGEGLPLVEILARDQELIAAMKQEEAEEGLRDVEQGLHQARTLDRKLADELRTAFPTLAILLAQDPAGQDHEAVYRTLLRLLESAKTALPDRRPALMLAADRLADRLGYEYPPSPHWDQERERLAGHGLTYTWDQLGFGWQYANDLLWRVWQEYGSTEWGEHAFVLLQNAGWDTGVGCDKGSDRFREVIRRGENFLAQRPQSPRRLDVLFALAQAYETWWSVSQASEQDEYAQSGEYRQGFQEGVAEAREKAIAYYEHVLQLAPESGEAAYARRRLPRLKARLDTNQRRFFCSYD